MIRYCYLVSLWLVLVSVETRAEEPESPPLPPLTEPATGSWHSGKFVWADLFASEFEEAIVFWSSLFGWEWQPQTDGPGGYGVFYHHGQPVAGLVDWEPEKQPRPYGRWVHYISTADVSALERRVVSNGGRAVSVTREIPGRGTQAVLADPEGVLFGVMRSSSGDPDDFLPSHGEWLWFNLYSNNAEQAAAFYTSLFDYTTSPGSRAEEAVDIVLTKESLARGGVTALEPADNASPSWLGFIRVEDVNEMLDRVEELGGEVLYHPGSLETDLEMAVIAGPSGGFAALLEWPIEANNSNEQSEGAQ